MPKPRLVWGYANRYDDLHWSVERQARDSDHGARVRTSVTQNVVKKIRGAIEDFSVVLKPRSGLQVTFQSRDADNGVEGTQKSLQLCQHVYRAKTRGVIAGRSVEVSTQSAKVANLSVRKRELAREK